MATAFIYCRISFLLTIAFGATIFIIYIPLEIPPTGNNVFRILETDSIIIEKARILTSKYKIQGLRTLDSIQLSTAVSLFQHVDIFFSADKLLKSLFDAEGLPTEMSGS